MMQIEQAGNSKLAPESNVVFAAILTSSYPANYRVMVAEL